ncbi:MAG TPA: C25 family cysteine peptidase [Acidobacteriota bacterium]|nr:C25 family cysteine peptidase [Acidobacteriota bacterium]HNT17035.1 C25 family cysteine peptidase [Acidobacteriota bacterium]
MFKNSFLAKSVVSTVLISCLWVNVCALELEIKDVRVDDSVELISCAYQGELDRHMKGNADGALSPGERVRLAITVENRTGFDITYMHAVISDDSIFLNTISPNCYAGTGGGGIGVRYVEFGSWGNGEKMSNFDPFVVEVSQDMACGKFVEFGVTFYYRTSDPTGGCYSSPDLCSETHYFTLPVFALTDPLVLQEEKAPVPSSDDHTVVNVATNSRDIGYVISRSGAWEVEGCYFSRMDYEGTVMWGPKRILDYGINGDNNAFFYNDKLEKYQLVRVGYDGFTIVSIPDTESEAVTSETMNYPSVFPPFSEAVIINSCFYDNTTTVDPMIVVVFEADNLHTYICKYPPMAPYSPSQATDLGQTSSYSPSSCSSTAYLPEDEASLTPAAYFVATDAHDGTKNVIRVSKIRALDLFLMGTYEIPVSVEYSTPSVVIDDINRMVVVAYDIPASYNPGGSIRCTVFDEDLVPVNLDKEIEPPDPDPDPSNLYYSKIPRLIFNCGNFYMVTQESRFSALSSRVMAGLFDPYSFPNPKLLTAGYASEEWLMMGNLKSVNAGDRCYAFWNDSRDTYPGITSIHYSAGIYQDIRMPYNANVFDDEIISQAYEHTNHPSLACNATKCLTAWVHQDSTDPWGRNIFKRDLSADGTMLDSAPVQISFGNGASWYSHVTAVDHGGVFEVFWREGDVISKWTEPNFTDNGIYTLYNIDSLFLDAAPFGSYSDLLLVRDMRGTDTGVNLYAVKYDHGIGVSYEVNLTNYQDTMTNVIMAKCVSVPGSSNEIAVAWLEEETGQMFRVKVAVLGFDLNYVIDHGVSYPYTVMQSPTAQSVLQSFAMAANESGIMFLLPNGYMYDYYLDYLFLETETGYVSRDSLKQRHFSYWYSPFIFPGMRWDGNQFLYSWLERGLGTERLFFYGKFDECGSPIAWPVRIASPKSYMFPPPESEANYEVESTEKGALAIYTKGSGSSQANVYLAAMSWEPDSMSCALYNDAPVLSANGAYAIEYGSGITLNGTAADDTAMGDYIASAGWDVTGDSVVDFDGLQPIISFDQLKQKGWVSPRSSAVSFIAADRHGLSSSASTTLTIQDTTPPTVEVSYPDGGETLRVGGSYTIMWTGSDNYQLDHFNVYYCTDWNGDPDTATWIKINSSNIPGTQFFYDWTIPDDLSSTCRVKVEAFDKGVPEVKNNFDISGENFYIVQATTSSIKTLILRSTNRINQFYPGQATLVGEKLAQLMVNGKVTGFIVELDSIPGLSTLYDTWDGEPTSVTKANAVAEAIRAYVANLVRTDYTNVEYLVIVGDDRIVPFYRIADATPGAYSEDDYTGSVDCATATGGAICQDYYLTDNIYGDIGYWNGDSWEDYEVTTEGSNFMALPDLGIGRLVETPEQIATTIDAFITMDGQVTLDSLTTANVFVAGYDFLTDSATTIKDKYDTPYMVDNLLGGAWTHDQLETALFEGLQEPTPHPYVLNSLNGHCTHYTMETPNGGPLPTTEMEADHPGQSLNGRVFYSAGCHSGLNVPSSFTNSYDLPEMMMEKGAIAYVGNTGYGWGLKHGTGYTEKLMEMVTDKMLAQQMISLGQALSQAKREYYIQDKRYDVFDEKVLFESTLYGLPMYRIVMSQSSIVAPRDFSGAAGPDHEEVNGITLDKKLVRADDSNLLPSGVTELALNFEFGPGTHQLVHTADGDYYKLNGKMNGEAGDSLQPLFIYESRLSGVVSHGVIFTGGTFTNYADFEPVIATPESSSPLVPPEPIAPVMGAFVPTVNVSHPQLPSSLVSTDLTKLTVYTGYFKKYPGETTLGTETLFDTVGFSVYYSNSSDKTAPSFPSPPAEGGDYHTLTGTNCAFSVQASDAGTGLYRVLVTYSDNTASWQSLDLAYNGSSSRWEGSLTLSNSITYFVQAVDNAGNCKVLKSNEGMSGLDPATGLPYVVAARLFEVQFLDSDSDGMPNDWETANGTNPDVADANADPDDDGLTNIQEMVNNTNPQDEDTDNDGMEDGWEVAKGLNPLADDAALDPDHDSLTNLDEYGANTNPYDADTDDDSMPDGWEVTYGLNPLAPDSALDGDLDGLNNGEEYAASTKPIACDSDGDGDNDGSEENNGRDPNLAGDGKRITIFETLDGEDVIINWPSGSGDNGVIDGPYWIYRSTVPYHGSADELATTPLPLEDGTTTYRDVGAAGGTETYFYTVTNSRYTAPAPAIGAIVPSSGPAGTAVSIYGTNFVTGATVKVGGVTAGSVVVQNASLITCVAPANSLGAKDVTVTNPNGQFVTKPGGFTYTAP